MKFFRNEKVRYQGRTMIVTENNYGSDTVELAEPGWDGRSDGICVPVTEVTPLEQMLPDEVSHLIDGLTPEQMALALRWWAGCAPQGLVEFGRNRVPELLPERLT